MMMTSKNAPTITPTELTSGERAQIRNAAPVYDLIRFEEKEAELRCKSGIGVAYDHIYFNNRKSDGDVLANQLKYQRHGDMLDKMIGGMISKGRMVTPQDQRALTFMLDTAMKCHDKAHVFRNSFNRMREGSQLPAGYRPADVIDG